MSVKPPSQVPSPPEGNYSYGPLVNITDGWIEALDVIVMVLRVATRLFLTDSKLWWDDYFILGALAATLWQLGGNGIEVHYGYGRPEHFLSDHELRYFLAYSYGEWIQTFFTLTCTKVSMCFFLLRLPASRKLVRPLQVAIVFLLVSNLVITIMWILQCHPLDLAWNINLQGACFSKDTLVGIIMAQAIISIVSDFSLSLYPILILRNLRTSLRNKVGLSVLMGLGVITGACAIVRTVLYKQWIPDDITYGGIENWFWRTFEVNLGMICVCIPTLIPGYKWVRRKLRQRAQRHLPDSIAPDYPTAAQDAAEVEEIRHPEPTATIDASRTERALLGRALIDLESQAPTHQVQVEGSPALPHGQHKVSVVLDDEDIRGTLRQSEQAGSSLSHSSRFAEHSSQEDSGRRDASPQSTATPGSDRPLVRQPHDPEKSLAVDLRPSFRDNRSLWTRMMNRLDGSTLSFLRTTNADSKVE